MAYSFKKAWQGAHNVVSNFADKTNPLAQIARKGTVAGDLVRGDVAGAAADTKSHKADKAKTLAEQMQNKENDQYGQNQAYAKTLADQDQSYLGTMQGNVGKYQTDLDTLRGEAEASQKDARNTYSNDIQPRLKGLMEQNQQNAAGAMSLQDASDPNNKVATATRGLYETQAKNEGRSGLADAATLQALGAQNFGTQLGGAGPMTGGQLSALMGQNASQSSAAYGKSLQRQHDLRDQGLSQGFARSDLAYDRGQNAMNQYGQSVGNYEGAADRQLGRDTNFRNQRGGYAGQTYGLQQQMNDATRGANQAGTQRDMSIYNQHMGGQQANIAGQIGQLNAQQAQQAQMVTGGLQAAGTVAGAYFGGPGGAAAGGQVGQQIGQQNAPQANPIPQYGNYGSASAGNQNPSMQQQNMGIQTYMNANPSGPSGYNFGGNGAQMGPPSPVGSSAGSAGAAQMNGLSLADQRPQNMAQRMRR